MIEPEHPTLENPNDVEDQDRDQRSSPEGVEHTNDQHPPADPPGIAELAAMQASYSALAPLEASARQRAVTWLIESLGLADAHTAAALTGRQDLGATNLNAQASRADEVIPSPREFIGQKRPQSQAERITCLAYYLTHYRNTNHFKTPDISSLNTEAAGQKFGNISRDIDNADRHGGYIVSAGKGAKQLTSRGEAVVNALPSREEVKQALQEHPYRLKRTTTNGKRSSQPAENDR